MPETSGELLLSVLRASALLSVGFVLVWTLLHCLKIRSPHVHGLCWGAVLIQGVLLIPVSFHVPVLNVDEAPQSFAHVSSKIVSALAMETADSAWSNDESLLTPSYSATVRPESDFDLTVFLLSIWIGGIFVCLGTSVLRYWMFRRRALAETCRVEVGRELEEWIAQWENICVEAGIAHSIPLSVTQNFGPCVYWIRRETCLLIPHQQWSGLTEAQRELVLRHEAAHIVRRDLWTGLLIQVAASVQWFNPFAWFCVRKLAETSEWACDDIVRRQPAAQVPEYVKALLEFSVSVHRVPAFVSSASAHSVVLRARRLLNPNVKDDSRMKKLTTTLAAMMLVAAGLLNPHLVAMDSDDETKATDSPTSAAKTDSDGEDSTKSAALTPSADSETPAIDADDSITHTDFVYRPGAGVLLEQATPLGNVILLSDDSVLQTSQLKFVNEPRRRQRGTREAVVDMAYVFEHLPEFRNLKKSLQERVKLEGQKVQVETRAIQAIVKQLKNLALEERTSLETQLAERQAKLNSTKTLTQKRLMEEEAKVYSDIYRKIREAIAVHAKENDIDIVRRASIRGLDRLNSLDPKAVLQAMNTEVLYVADDGKIDITKAVLERLTKASDATESEL